MKAPNLFILLHSFLVAIPAISIVFDQIIFYAIFVIA